jgi:hypothetical protein
MIGKINFPIPISWRAGSISPNELQNTSIWSRGALDTAPQLSSRNLSNEPSNPKLAPSNPPRNRQRNQEAADLSLAVYTVEGKKGKEKRDSRLRASAGVPTERTKATRTTGNGTSAGRAMPALAARVFPSWGAGERRRGDWVDDCARVVNEGALPLLLASPNPETTRTLPALTTAGRRGSALNPAPSLLSGNEPSRWRKAAEAQWREHDEWAGPRLW